MKTSPRIRNAGVRIARQRLKRFRKAGPRGQRVRKWITLGVAVWVLWVLFLSDHSVFRLLHLQAEKDNLHYREENVAGQLAQAQRRLPAEVLSDQEIERIVRERYTFARPGEIVYIVGEDSVRVVR